MPTAPDPSQAPTCLLALVPERDAQVVQDAAVVLHGEVRVTHGLSAFLRALQDREWSATLVSLSGDLVDDPVIERIAHSPHRGALLLCAPAVSLERALLMERVGAVALLREPLSEADLAERLSMLTDEGPEVVFPPTAELDREGAEARPRLLGSAENMGRVFETVARVARSDATVLLTGESGSGKEVVARSLHWAGDRRQSPFVAVNCAAIPEQLLESELFGHQRGAFTGAVAPRVGRFEQANGGTILLDEIGDMSLVLQAKVLRVLEDRRVEPVGGDGPRAVDVRVIAATNHDLHARIAEGSFREDLYFRLAVVEIHLPPLRDRQEDIRSLSLHFAAQSAARHGRELNAITESALRRLEGYAWPGNVRELRNVLDRAVLLANGPRIGSNDLRLGAGAPRASARADREGGLGYPTAFSLEEVEADHIQKVLDAVDGHIGNASGVLGIHRNTLTRKVQEYGLRTRGEGRSAP